MKNDYERRLLCEIEAALRESDPGLDQALRTFRPRRRWTPVLLVGGWLVAVTVCLIGWWIVAVVMLGPLLAITWITLDARGLLTPTAMIDEGGVYPPTWTRFWG